MSFLEDLGKKVTDVGQKTVQKTKEMSEIARINSLVTQKENKVNNVYYQIGKLYVNMHGNEGEEEFTEMVATVAELEKQITAYRKQIQDIKGVQRCAKCGAEVPADALFCNYCGEAIPRTEKQEEPENCVKCNNCGSWVKKEMRFCTNCGKPMVQSAVLQEEESKVQTALLEENAVWDAGRTCPRCGAKQSDDSAFCTECGNKL